MGNIYIKELKNYFHTFFGWLFLALLTAFFGMFIVYINLLNGIPYISQTISSMVVILMFVFPLLTMRTLAAEKRNKTDQLLLTSPIRVSSVILGKFLALLTMLCIGCLVLFLGMLIMSRYGSIPVKESLLSVFGLILFGAMLASIGMFMSSLTEHQIIAAVLTYGSYIFFWFVPQIMKSVFSSNAVIVFFAKIIDVLAPFDRIFSGILNAKDILYILTVIFIFLLLSGRVFGKSSLTVSLVGIKRFWFSNVGIAALLLLLIGGNIGFSFVNDKYVQKDMTEVSFFTISSESKALAGSLNSQLTIHVLTDETTADGTLKTILGEYASENKNIKIKYHSLKDEPNFYTGYTTQEPTVGSLILVGNGRSRVIDANDYYVSEFNYQTYQSEITGIDMEGQITAGIQYLWSDETYSVYVLEGHGEPELSDNTKDRLRKAGFELNSLVLLKEEKIPEDCSLLIINGPTSDLTDEDVSLVSEYIKNGGAGFFIASSDILDTPNYDRLISSYGAVITNGMIWDTDPAYSFQGVGYYIIPSTAYHEITNNVYNNKKPNLFIESRGFTLEDTDPDLSPETLFSTSDSSLEVTTGDDGLSIEETGKEGPFALGYYSEQITGEKKGKVVGIGSYLFLHEEPDAMTSYAATDVLTDAASFMCDMTLKTSIPAKQYTSDMILVTIQAVYLFFILLVIVIPLLEIAAGIVILILRKRKK